jgi:hypothetical protein
MDRTERKKVKVNTDIAAITNNWVICKVYSNGELDKSIFFKVNASVLVKRRYYNVSYWNKSYWP